MADSPTVEISKPHEKLAKACMLMGLGTLVFSAWLARAGLEPFATWFYNFAWWGYILFIDGWVYRRRGESLLISFPGRFFFYAACSVPLWFLFELFNLRLHNWAYHNLPGDLWQRWPGYFLAFATVIPALLETADFIDAAGLIKDAKVKPLGWKFRVKTQFLAAGALMLALPIILPKFFFPLIWGAFIFLLEPLNERWDAPSLLSDWREGRMKRFVTLLLAGLICGLLWEWWNSWSLARWSYEIPWVGQGRVFAMPLLGYLGFAPFAVQVFVMTAFFTTVWERSSAPARFFWAAAALAFSLGMCRAVDQFSVRSFL